MKQMVALLPSPITKLTVLGWQTSMACLLEQCVVVRPEAGLENHEP